MRDLLDCTLPANKKFVDELLRRCKNSVHVPVGVQVIQLVIYLAICQPSYPHQVCACVCIRHWCVHRVTITSDSPQTRKTHVHSNTETSTDKDVQTVTHIILFDFTNSVQSGVICHAHEMRLDW